MTSFSIPLSEELVRAAELILTSSQRHMPEDCESTIDTARVQLGAIRDLLFRAAEEGDRDANYCAAIVHQLGIEGGPNQLSAFRCFEKAAQAGHADAAYQVVRSCLLYRRDPGPVSFGNDFDAPKLTPDEAVQFLRVAASQGHVHAQVELSLLLSSLSEAAPERPVLAHEAQAWLVQAVRADDPRAQRLIGFRYLAGRSVSRNASLGNEHLHRAAMLGDRLAMLHLADSARESGDGGTEIVHWHRCLAYAICKKTPNAFCSCSAGSIALLSEWPDASVADHIAKWLGTACWQTAEEAADGLPDAARARLWLERAATRGALRAQEALAEQLLASDKPTDRERGIYWLSTAAGAGSSNAARSLGDCCIQGNGVVQSDVQALEWWRRSVALGSWEAPYLVGWMYEHGRGVAQDYVEAAKWYRQVAERTPFARPTAVYSLARLYHLGLGVERDSAEAVHWYQVAADYCHGWATYAIGRMLEEGDGVIQDHAKAASWYLKCADRVPDAAYRLALMLKNGTLLARDDGEVFRHFFYAAQNGVVNAMFEVAQRHAAGVGTPVSPSEARRWFERASDAGHPHAEVELARLMVAGGEAGRAYSAFRQHDLKHRTANGELVRSKSEVIVANALLTAGARYHYEMELRTNAGVCIPDFTIFDADGKRIIWEHLGLLHHSAYKAKWDAKRALYEQFGFSFGIDLFITRDGTDGGLDSEKVRRTAEFIRGLTRTDAPPASSSRRD